jgi:hypothetical protein
VVAGDDLAIDDDRRRTARQRGVESQDAQHGQRRTGALRRAALQQHAGVVERQAW